MPISKSPLEYYRYYCASQRRVEQWVQDTERLSQTSPVQSERSTTQWRGFLEDPGLATPISLFLPLDKSKPESEDQHLTGVPKFGSQDSSLYPTPEVERLCEAHELDDDSSRALNQRRPPLSTMPQGSRNDSTPSQPTRAVSQKSRTDETPVTVHVPVVPTSSKLSKDSKQSRNTNTSKSKSSLSRKRQHRKVHAYRSIFVYVPYGIIPVLIAMTTGSSAVSLAAASIMLAGYFCLDFTRTVSFSSTFPLQIPLTLIVRT